MFSTSNNLGRVTKQTYEDGDTVTYRYDNSGALATVEDSATGRKTTYYYDFTDRLMKYVETGTNYYHSVGYEYDQLNNLTALVETINGTDYTTSYAYDDDNRVASVTTGGTTVEYTYDAYGRISQQVTKRGDTTVLTETYTYVGTDTTTSGQIATYKTETANYSVTYSYTYDDNGNILSVNDGTYTTTYVYDSANQLIRENNQRRNRSYTWAYDNAGNILSQKAYVYTTGDITESTATVATNSYTYGDEDWGDLLTAYNGIAISYDEIGNPDGYGGRTFTWEHGRQMATQTRNGATWSYTYDANGMRTKRSSDSKTYEYVYSGDKLVQMTVTDHTTSPETVQLMEFSYDAAGQPLTFTIDGVTYYYMLNIQGDVMGMVDGDGNLLYTMVYEGYGAGYYFSGGTAAATMLLNTNPLGYRGYVKDAGTGLYYLQSRYYDPAMGRFINADAYASTGQGFIGNNMFAYCGNNPVRRRDSNGQLWLETRPSANVTVICADSFWGCSATKSATESTPSHQEKSYAATIYAEAAGQNYTTKCAVAHVMNNRIGTRRAWTDIEAVISAKHQFVGYQSSMYKSAMEYYTTGTWENSIERAAMDDCLEIAISIYNGRVSDFTGGALYFHSFPNPSDWLYHASYKLVKIPGTEGFWFYTE